VNTGIISSRYARALLKLVDDIGDGELVCSQFPKVLDAIKKVPELYHIVNDPKAVTVDQKMTLLKSSLAPETMTPSLEKFLTLLIRNGRMDHGEFIFHAFSMLYYESRNIRFATLTTAEEAPQWLVDKIVDLIHNTYGSKVVLDKKVDPDIIGGLVLMMDDWCVDASIARQLDEIRKEFNSKNKRIV